MFFSLNILTPGPVFKILDLCKCCLMRIIMLDERISPKIINSTLTEEARAENSNWISP